MQYSTCRKSKSGGSFCCVVSRGLGSCKCIYMHEIILKPQNQDMEWTRNYKDTNQLPNAAQSTIGTFRRSRKRKARSNVDSEGVAHWPVKHTKRGKCKQCTAEKQRHEVETMQSFPVYRHWML